MLVIIYCERKGREREHSVWRDVAHLGDIKLDLPNSHKWCTSLIPPISVTQNPTSLECVVQIWILLSMIFIHSPNLSGRMAYDLNSKIFLLTSSSVNFCLCSAAVDMEAGYPQAAFFLSPCSSWEQDATLIIMSKGINGRGYTFCTIDIIAKLHPCPVHSPTKKYCLASSLHYLFNYFWELWLHHFTSNFAELLSTVCT